MWLANDLCLANCTSIILRNPVDSMASGLGKVANKSGCMAKGYVSAHTSWFTCPRTWRWSGWLSVVSTLALGKRVGLWKLHRIKM